MCIPCTIALNATPGTSIQWDREARSAPGVKEFMKIDRFEDIEAWQRAHELTWKVYRLTRKPGFAMKSARRSTVNLTT